MTQQVFTIPFMVCRLQRQRGQIEAAIRDLRIEPALKLNEAVYYGADDESRIADELHRRDVANLEREA